MGLAGRRKVIINVLKIKEKGVFLYLSECSYLSLAGRLFASTISITIAFSLQLAIAFYFIICGRFASACCICHNWDFFYRVLKVAKKSTNWKTVLWASIFYGS
jgi:hypothetical protein